MSPTEPPIIASNRRIRGVPAAGAALRPCHDGDGGKTPAIGFPLRDWCCRAGRAPAAAQQIGQMTKKRFVSIGLPGPTTMSTSRIVFIIVRATCESPLMAWQTSTALFWAGSVDRKSVCHRHTRQFATQLQFNTPSSTLIAHAARLACRTLSLLSKSLSGMMFPAQL